MNLMRNFNTLHLLLYILFYSYLLFFISSEWKYLLEFWEYKIGKIVCLFNKIQEFSACQEVDLLQ